jgi:hypothetical protein
MKLTHIIKEIGEGSSKPYSYGLSRTLKVGSSVDYTYGFKVNEDWEGMILLTHYEVERGNILNVDFNVIPKYSDGSNYEMTNLGLGVMFRTMSTIIHVIKNDVPKRIKTPITHITISPVSSKTSNFGRQGDSQRMKLYNAYIKKHMKIKRIQSRGSGAEYELQTPIEPK